MSNADVRDELVALQARVAAGEVTIKDVGRQFERLTLSLSAVSADDDARLRDWVNEVELIRFTKLPETQIQAVVEVLRQTRSVFELAA